MGDDRRDDWTQGPELSAEQARRERERRQASPEAASPEGGEDAETLRERQRLAQLAMLDRWIDGVLVEQRRSRRWKLFFRFLLAFLILASLTTTLYGLFVVPGSGAVEGPHLGVVRVEGVIDRESRASAERVIEGVQRAWRAPGAEAVVLHIDSPGGSPVQSQRIHDELMRLREQGDKPIIAVVEDIGASGAYYIAAGADEIIAAPASLVGSIGVIHAGFGFQKALDGLGVERRVFTAGENKAFLDPFSEISPEQRDFWQRVLATTHRQFIEDVKAGRGGRLADDERLFSGLIWTGEQARELGLVDALGSLDTLARERLTTPRVRDYTPRLDPLERLARRFGRVAAEWAGLPSAASPVRYQLN
ncbi:signal peptide peptidase SppA [Halomonas koreensis]|uniref:Signal peptide peptidase SppA n=1 Tax=Halomonas koreensis TaxID=245385 RepID=A0ABU1G5M9_9GAMM|nr:signal peptide peptidase SppA [Halomonas koreensis]MDR5868258.1 signal peptide peptidase SppA [Halomonas koreensis]